MNQPEARSSTDPDADADADADAEPDFDFFGTTPEQAEALPAAATQSKAWRAAGSGGLGWSAPPCKLGRPAPSRRDLCG